MPAPVPSGGVPAPMPSGGVSVPVLVWKKMRKERKEEGEKIRKEMKNIQIHYFIHM